MEKIEACFVAKFLSVDNVGLGGRVGQSRNSMGVPPIWEIRCLKCHGFIVWLFLSVVAFFSEVLREKCKERLWDTIGSKRRMSPAELTPPTTHSSLFLMVSLCALSFLPFVFSYFVTLLASSLVFFLLFIVLLLCVLIWSSSVELPPFKLCHCIWTLTALIWSRALPCLPVVLIC